MRYLIAIAVVIILFMAVLLNQQPIESDKQCFSGSEMASLRDSFLMDEMEKGAYSSFREPFVDSILDAEAARRADSMYLHRLSQYD